jgi:hypothetical protein
VDQEIELAEPNFTPLASEEAAEAVRLLAALIGADRARTPDSPNPPPWQSLSPENLAGDSPLAPRGRGKAVTHDGAGDGR